MEIDSQKRHEYINYGDEDEMEIWGYKRKPIKIVIITIMIIFSLGLLGLIFYWKPNWLLKCTSDRCSLNKADSILLKDKWNDVFVEYVSIESQDESDHKKKKIWPTSLSWTSKIYQHKKNSGACHDSDDPFSTSNLKTQRYFFNKKLKYLWNEEQLNFQSLVMPPLKCSFLHASKGLTLEQSHKRYWLYGENFIRVHMTPVIVLLITQGLTPFYVFQVFSILLWSAAESYYYYAACIFVMSVISLIAQVVQERMMERGLKRTISNIENCFVARPESNETKFVEMSTADLVPGDVIRIPADGCVMHCDAVLTCGTVIVNESMLTGESVPITKTSILDSEVQFNEKDHSRNVLYSGTCVIQTRTVNKQHVTAMVIRTGFFTTKGSLVRSILYPKSMDFKFTRDSYKYVGALACIAIIGMIYTACCMALGGAETEDVIIRMLDVVTIVVPPALPAALTYSIVMAQYRLKRKLIYCINSKSINVCGSLDAFCFDKTGTLTEDGLDLHCIHPCSNFDIEGNNSDSGLLFSTDENNIKFAEPIFPLKTNVNPNTTDSQMLSYHHITVNMAACHSLAFVNGKFMGDPIDLKMFEYTQWDFIELSDAIQSNLNTPIIVKPKLPDQQMNKLEYGVLRQQPFSSKLQRMSVIVRSQQLQQKPQHQQQHHHHHHHHHDQMNQQLPDYLSGKQVLNNFSSYVKGSPEMISSLSLPHTVPPDFKQILVHYTQQGFRVLALAWKPLYTDVSVDGVDDVLKVLDKMDREEIESSLMFLGLVVMENPLKIETVPSLNKLKCANIKIVMVTGDNLLTALNVAHKCSFVDVNEAMYLISLDFPDDNSNKPNLLFCQINEFEDMRIEKLTLNDFLGKHSSEANLKDMVTKDSKYHFAITGKMWKIFRTHYPHLLPQLVVRGTIFARFSPDQKQQLVEELQAAGYYVGMCGDGANDCGALKSAHSGISLSEAEASVASPFTSKEPNISCVVRLIREGRCALATSFGIFKFMAGYSLTQFLIACLFVWNLTLLSDMQFMYQDIFLLTPLSFTFCFTSSYKVLVPRKPLISLVAITPLLSLVVNLLLNLAAMIFMYYNTEAQIWFENEVTDGFVSHRSTSIFLVTTTHIVTMAVIYSRGPPFQKYCVYNYSFLINVIIVTAASYLMIMYSNTWWSDVMKFKMPPSYEYRGVIVGITIFHFFACYLFEKYIIGELVETVVQPWLSKKFYKTQAKHENIEALLSSDENWPQVTRMDIDQFMDREVSIDVVGRTEISGEQISNLNNVEHQQMTRSKHDSISKKTTTKENFFANECFIDDIGNETMDE